MNTNPKHIDELAEIIKPAMPNHCCGPDDMDDCPYDAHDAHGIAKAVIAAGWVSPAQHQADVDVALSDGAAVLTNALLRQEEIQERAEKAEAERATWFGENSRAQAALGRVRELAATDGIWKGKKHVRLTRRDPRLGCEITESYVTVADLREALGEPERDHVAEAAAVRKQVEG